jgi:hypothetical protein
MEYGILNVWTCGRERAGDEAVFKKNEKHEDL